jgi:uncharacterized protein (TIGR02147 family)
VKTQLAIHLNCQSSFISQVLNGDKTHFSLEHIKKISVFLQLSVEETDYLILMCLYERAGSVDLKDHFLQKLKEIQERHQDINQKINKRGQGLSAEQKATYYSHWGYMAAHMLVSIPELATLEKLQEQLKISDKFLNEIVDFLLECELIQKKGNKFSIGKTRIHLDKKSPFVKTLHQNWRHKAIESLSEDNDFDLHYSSVLVLSKKDSLKIKDLILNFIKEKEVILAPSAEEQMVVLNLDYFKM